MSGICGWIDHSDKTDSSDCITQMADHLPPIGTLTTPINGKDFVIASRSNIQISNNEKDFIAIQDGDIVIALDGDTSWDSEELTNYCIKAGNTKTIAYAYKKYGDKFLTYLHGAFSLALYDTANDCLILAIDRMGIKPMCYSNPGPDKLLFSSNLGPLLQHPSIDKTLDSQSIYSYVYFHFIPSPQTIYKQINKLEPGTCLIYKKEIIEIKRYWFPSFTDQGQIDISDAGTKLMEILKNTIKKFGKVKNTGAFLSGGLDSSTVSGVLANSQNNPVDTYSIGFSAEGYDETAFARITAKHFNTTSHEYYVTPEDIVTAFPIVAKAYEEPFGNSSAIPAYFCARLAFENGTTTLLAGDGGDELFAGNERYVKQKLLEHYQSVPQFLRTLILEPLFLGIPFIKYIPILKKIRSYIEQARVSIVNRMGTETYNYLQGHYPAQIFTDNMLNTIDTKNPISLLNSTYNESPSSSFMHSMLYLDWKFTLADNDLRKVNRMCEISGVEVKYPMLDDELVDFSTHIPPEVKLKGTKLRYFFKYAVENFLPNEIINKQKHGFGLPFGVWLKTSPELKKFVYDSLESLKQREIIQPDFIDQIITTHKEGHAAYYGAMIWALAMLEQWFQQHSINGKIV